MTVRHDHWIGGQAVAPAGGAYLPTVDPHTRQSGDEVAAGSAPDVDAAVRAADAAPAWAGQSAAHRSKAVSISLE
jgi:aldehyde dehydrogenase (NAD+)